VQQRLLHGVRQALKSIEGTIRRIALKHLNLITLNNEALQPGVSDCWYALKIPRYLLWAGDLSVMRR
jgi:hypothetical protein